MYLLQVIVDPCYLQVIVDPCYSASDTTSRLYGIGKKASLSKIQSSDELSKISEIFMQNQRSMDSECTHHSLKSEGT